jgi:uncharacterized protein YhbP (UPF0306 family)
MSDKLLCKLHTMQIKMSAQRTNANKVEYFIYVIYFQIDDITIYPIELNEICYFENAIGIIHKILR